MEHFLQLLCQWEGGVLLALQSLRSPVLDAFFVWYTQLGNAGLVWIVVSLLMLLSRRTRKTGVLALGALLLGFVCCNLVIKPLVGRARPWMLVEGLRTLVTEHDPNSFPSGHTCAAFAAAGIWCRGLPRRWMRVSAVAAAVLMGFSRLYVGVHFPSDVLAGALVGCLCAWVVWSITKIGTDRK